METGILEVILRGISPNKFYKYMAWVFFFLSLVCSSITLFIIFLTKIEVKFIKEKTVYIFFFRKMNMKKSGRRGGVQDTCRVMKEGEW